MNSLHYRLQLQVTSSSIEVLFGLFLLHSVGGSHQLLLGEVPDPTPPSRLRGSCPCTRTYVQLPGQIAGLSSANR
jgi:hypothetical protein